MKMKKMIVAGLATLAVAAAVTTVAVAQDKDKGRGRDRDELVTLAQTPEAVQKTILQHATAMDIKKVEQDNEDGQVAYSVEIVKGDKETELDIAADGTLMSADEEMALTDAPEAVQKALATQEGKVHEISRLTENNVVQYEATLDQNGEESEVVVTADGQVSAKNDAEEEGHDGEGEGEGEHKSQWGEKKGHDGDREGRWGEHKGCGGDRWSDRKGHGEENEGRWGERKDDEEKDKD